MPFACSELLDLVSCYLTTVCATKQTSPPFSRLGTGTSRVTVRAISKLDEC